MYYEAFKRGLNVDRLQKVSKWIDTYGPGQPCHLRAEGFTMTYIMWMLGEAEVGRPGNVYLYVGENALNTKWVKRDFHHILDDLGFSVTAKHDRLFVKGTDGYVRVFWFHACNSYIDQYAKGWVFNRIFIDVMEDTLWRYDEQMGVVRYQEHEEYYQKNMGADYVHRQLAHKCGTSEENRGLDQQVLLLRDWREFL